MKYQVHALNMDDIHEEAEKVRTGQAEGSGGRDASYHEWQEGDNTARLGPPYNARGHLFKKQYTHFQLPLKDDRVATCLCTWPELFDSCPICSAIDKILARFPQLELRRQSRTLGYRCNLVDRDEESKGMQVSRISPGLRNWFVTQIDNKKIGNIADIETGFDITVNKTVKKVKGQTQTKYNPSFVPERCPLSEDDEKTALWISQIIDLDKFTVAPDEAELAELNEIAERLIAYYTKKAKSRDVDVGDPELDDDDFSDPPSKPAGDKPKKPTKEKAEASVDLGDLDDDPPADKSTEKEEPPQSIAEVDPNSVPACFAGLDNPEPHKNGSIGFIDDLEKCIFCAEELPCQSAKAKKGL